MFMLYDTQVTDISNRFFQQFSVYFPEQLIINENVRLNEALNYNTSQNSDSPKAVTINTNEVANKPTELTFFYLYNIP